MPIPAYIIDKLRKEERERDNAIYEELHIEIAVPNESTKIEPNDQSPNTGIEEVDFFI